MHPPRFHPDHLLSDWPDCYLDICCGCGGSSSLPVKLLLREKGDCRFRDVLPRLRCKMCGRGGAPVYLVAGHVRTFRGGGPANWSIELVHDPNWKREVQLNCPNLRKSLRLLEKHSTYGAGVNGVERRQGFTLIELSIVLVIIGLVVGGVLVGQDLVRSAGERAQITQIESYNRAVNTFRAKYNALPGDMNAGTAAQFGFAPRGSGRGQGDGKGVWRIKSFAPPNCRNASVTASSSKCPSSRFHYRTLLNQY